MALMSPKARGFTLYIAVVFAAVLTALGTALTSFVVKQSQLASAAVQSQYAFYAADAALECALNQDEQPPANGISVFSYSNHGVSPAPALLCGDNQTTGYAISETCYNTSSCSGYRYTRVGGVAPNLAIGLDGGTRCADVTVYKPSDPTQTTYFWANGYNAPCPSGGGPPTGTGVVVRGIEAQY